jgi:hypothetical protein
MQPISFGCNTEVVTFIQMTSYVWVIVSVNAPAINVNLYGIALVGHVLTG